MITGMELRGYSDMQTFAISQPAGNPNDVSMFSRLRKEGILEVDRRDLNSLMI